MPILNDYRAAKIATCQKNTLANGKPIKNFGNLLQLYKRRVGICCQEFITCSHKRSNQV